MLFANPILLIGLAATAVPLLVHFFSRRRYDEVEWGAMQFLHLTPKSRRRLFFEQWLLLAMRMAVLGLLAVALAGPAVRSALFATSDDRRPRSTVLLIDCSGSMRFPQNGQAATESARAWASTFLTQARPGDRIAMLAVKGDVVPVVGSLTGDFEQVRGALEMLPTPRGSADWLAAIEQAARVLESAPGEREIVVLSDGQRLGWSDATTLARWESLARERLTSGKSLPQIWVANVVPDRSATPAVSQLRPLSANRTLAVAGATVRFESGIRPGESADSLPSIRLEVDGRPAGTVALPPNARPDADVTLAFLRRFATGSHLVTLRTDADRTDLALDVVPTIPVLIVDGESQPNAHTLGGDFLRDALAPARNPAAAFTVRTVTVSHFTPGLLSQNVKGPDTAPRVVVLANVAKLTGEQHVAIERFLANRGSVLVAAGDRVDATSWNRLAFRNGRGWLPARFATVVGPENDPARAAKPRTAAFEHPAVRVFREELPGGLQNASFPEYWQLDPDPTLPRSAVVGTLSTGDPFLVEKQVGGGRVLVAAVPFDNSWRTNLPALPDFVRLAHELTYYLAGSQAAPANLTFGEPIVFQPDRDEPPAAVTVQRPDGSTIRTAVSMWPAVFHATRDPGAYKLTTATGRTRYYAVRPDPREVDLTPFNENDREQLARLGVIEFVASPDDLRDLRGRGPVVREVGGLLLVCVLVLLAGEVWYTRKLAAREG